MSAIEAHQAGQCRDQRSLAGAIGAEQTKELALAHLKIDAGKRPHSAKTLGNLLDKNRGSHGTTSSAATQRAQASGSNSLTS